MKSEKFFIQGNEACARGAIKAGCRFFAGYPITPSTEIAEDMAVFLPREGGTFIQMEDEISALGAVIGAVWGGIKGMTATSGPGFSLMQEHIGYAAMTETPLVIVNIRCSLIGAYSRSWLFGNDTRSGAQRPSAVALSPV